MARHIVTPDQCEYVGVPLDEKYPFILVYLKKEGGSYKAYTSPETSGYTRPGLLPLIDDPDRGAGWRRDSFFGVVNSQEELMPHELDFDEVDGVIVCQADLTFMERHRLLRLPLMLDPRGLPACPCRCGKGYIPNWPGFPEVGGYFKQLVLFPDPVWTKSVTGVALYRWSYSYTKAPTTFPPIAESWNFSFSYQIGVYMAQYANGPAALAAGLREPPTFPSTHPKCPNTYATQEHYWASFSNYAANHIRQAPVAPPETIFSVNASSNLVKGGLVGVECWQQNGGTFIDDNFKGTWNIDLAEVAIEPPVNFGDILNDNGEPVEDLPFQVPDVPELTFPPTSGGVIEIPSNFSPCNEPCECRPANSNYPDWTF